MNPPDEASGATSVASPASSSGFSTTRMRRKQSLVKHHQATDELTGTTHQLYGVRSVAWRAPVLQSDLALVTSLPSCLGSLEQYTRPHIAQSPSESASIRSFDITGAME